MKQREIAGSTMATSARASEPGEKPGEKCDADQAEATGGKVPAAPVGPPKVGEEAQGAQTSRPSDADALMLMNEPVKVIQRKEQLTAEFRTGEGEGESENDGEAAAKKKPKGRGRGQAKAKAKAKAKARAKARAKAKAKARAKAKAKTQPKAKAKGRAKAKAQKAESPAKASSPNDEPSRKRKGEAQTFARRYPPHHDPKAQAQFQALKDAWEASIAARLERQSSFQDLCSSTCLKAWYSALVQNLCSNDPRMSGGSL